MLDNNIMGSNPNVLANIEVRGQTAIDLEDVQSRGYQSTNNPLFIVDGFESSLRIVNDLDMNKVKSVTILKDASSTAIYGSKAANGVIVIETIRPEAGELMFTYDNNTSITSADLSQYNLMNAAEKLEYERLAGRYANYQGEWINHENSELGISEVYYDKLKLVNQGVNTYWLKIPLRTAVSHRHSISVSGGTHEGFNFRVDANYGDTEGVMKDDYRRNFGGGVRIQYRNKNVSIANNTVISLTNTKDSPYAPFSDFYNANPYYTARASDGSIPKFLEISDGRPGSALMANPLYNSQLSSFNRSTYTNIRNNINIDWFVTKGLRVYASLGVEKELSDNTAFVDPDNTRFDGLNYTKKGTYSKQNQSYWRYDANASIRYGINLLDAHDLGIIVRGSIDQKSNNSTSFSAECFPSGSGGIPKFAHSYTENTKPGYFDSMNRTVAAFAAFNYNFKKRYLFDTNFRKEGSNTFGSSQKYANFWSTGIGWNLHEESFAKNWNWADEIRLRASMGTTANQNQQLITSSIYSYFTGNNMFGQSSGLSQFGNPNLSWAKTKDWSVSLDAQIFKNRFSVETSLFQKKTSPQVLTFDQQPSTGVSSYPGNLGHLTVRGVEFITRITPIYSFKERKRLAIRFTGARTTDKFGGIGNALENLRDKSSGNLSARSLRRFQDGQSQFDIWAVRSLGIDPTTGKEVYLKKDGSSTFKHDTADEVVIANSRPNLQGSIGISSQYKNLEIDFNFSYRIGGYEFNNSLFQKVENITRSRLLYNLDRRALYDKWKNPGDISKYEAINMGSDSYTPVSSRFVQKNYSLRGESIRLTWDFSKDNWLKRTRIRELKLSLYLTDIFKWETMKAEFGSTYPNARTFTFNLSTRF